MVASFQDWIFPHDKLSSIWPHSPVTGTVVPGVCSFTFDESVRACLVPLSEAFWYITNRMGMDRGPLDRSIYGSSNMVPLRPDLHRRLEDNSFVIVPKQTPAGRKYVMAVLSTSAEEIWPRYHGCTAYQLSAESKPALFARFARTIFARANPWVGTGVIRTILRRHQDPYSKQWSYREERVHISEVHRREMHQAFR